MKHIITLTLLLFTATFLNAQTQTGTVEVSKGALFYQVIGEGKPTLFIPNGNCISSSAYLEQAQELADNLERQIILFDQRGTGKSTNRYNKLKLSRKIKDIEELRNHLGITQWDVIGQSYGGEYALAYLGKYSSSIDNVVLISTPVKTGKWFQSFNQEETEITAEQIEKIKAIQEEFAQFSKKEQENLQAKYEDKINRVVNLKHFIYDQSKLPELLDFNEKLVCGSDCKTNIDLEIIKYNKAFLDVKNPVLILHGKNDFIHYQSPKIINEKLQNSTLKMYDQCGHYIFFDKKSEMMSDIKSFFSEN